ncbi:MAG: c-type cytochrome [Burkholderiales bacterium]
MSDAHNDHDEAHTGPIKTPKQLIAAVFFSFVVPITVIAMLAAYVGSQTRPTAGSDALDREAIAKRLQSAGRVEIKDANEVAIVHTGEQVYTAQCSACHATGAAGAPKFGDADAWGPRIKTGYDALLHSALKGKNAMPPQGGGNFSDYEIGRAVVYMANDGGAKFEEPAAPAAAASAAASEPAK